MQLVVFIEGRVLSPESHKFCSILTCTWYF